MRTPRLTDPDLELGTLMTLWPETVGVFLRHKMLCVGCSLSRFHTVVDACSLYELDEVKFREELHQAVLTSR